MNLICTNENLTAILSQLRRKLIGCKVFGSKKAYASAPNCRKHLGMRAHCWALVLGDCDSLHILLCFTTVGACETNVHLVRLNILLHELCWQTHVLDGIFLLKLSCIKDLQCGIKSFLSLYKTFKLCK